MEGSNFTQINKAASYPYSSQQQPRELPHNIELEQKVLALLIKNNKAFDKVPFLKGDHFFDPLHKRIFDACSFLIGSGKQVTHISLSTYFEKESPISDDVSAPKYLEILFDSADLLLNIDSAGRMIVDLYKLRSLITACDEVKLEAYDLHYESSPDILIEELEGTLYNLAEKDTYGKGFRNFKDISVDVIEMVNNAYRRDGGLAGISTGLCDLDRKLGGLQKSDLIILAGRPSMGKTALATNIGVNIAKQSMKENTPGVVAFFSLEMSDEQVASRVLSSYIKISSDKLRRGQIDENGFRRLVDGATDFKDLPFEIDQSGGISIAQLASRARKMQRQKGLQLIIVDYIQLLSASKKNNGNRVQEVTEITTGLKALAKELDVPIVALSQLSRQVEQREDKHPQLSDLRESGSIEQDADVVMFVYREEYYISREEPPSNDYDATIKWQEKMERSEGIAEVIISKQRHGPTGTVELHFDGQFTQFSNMVRGGRS